MKVNDETQLFADVLPKSVFNSSIIWSSSNEDVAVVDQNGIVTAIGAGHTKIIAKSASCDGIEAFCEINVVIPVASIKISRTTLAIMSCDNYQLSVDYFPVDATNAVFEWKSSNNEVVKVNENGNLTPVGSGMATITVTLVGNSSFRDECVVTVMQMPDVDRHEAIDLGLSVKWASTNVGATNDNLYGEYYAYAETSTKRYYTEENYTYYSKRDGYEVPNNFAGKEQDVATVKWGNGWRMPTKSEMDELINECTWDWVSLNDVKGVKITGKNGNYIFLPASGEMSGYYTSSVGVGQNSTGYYYTAESALDYTWSACAYYLIFHNASPVGNIKRAYGYSGFSIRPVHP